MNPVDILSFAVMISPAAIINVLSLEHEFSKKIEKSEDGVFKNNFTMISNVVIIFAAAASYFIVKKCSCPCYNLFAYIGYNLLLLSGLISFFLFDAEIIGVSSVAFSAISSIVVTFQYMNNNFMSGVLSLPCVAYASYLTFFLYSNLLVSEKENGENTTCSCGMNNILGESII